MLNSTKSNFLDFHGVANHISVLVHYQILHIICSQWSKILFPRLLIKLSSRLNDCLFKIYVVWILKQRTV